MSTNSISAAAAANRENARQADGKFGEQAHAEAGQLGLGLSDGAVDEGAAELSEEQIFVRIDSLMGRRLHLDPSRSARMPKINATDSIAKVMSKMTTYTANTQLPDAMSDDEVATACGFTLADDQEVPAALRKPLSIPDDENIVVCLDEEGQLTYVSRHNVFPRNATYQLRPVYDYENRTWTERMKLRLANLAQASTVHGLTDGLAGEHPEFEEKQINQLRRQLTDRTYAGKRYTHAWAENELDNRGQLALAATYREENPDITGDQALALAYTTSDPDEIKARFEKYPIQERNVFAVENGAYVKRTVPCYVIGDSASVPVDEVRPRLDSSTPVDSRAARARLNRAFRERIDEQLADEYDYTLQRTYVRSGTGGYGARVFEEKMHIPQSHLDAAEYGYFKTSGDFRHVEIDADTDLVKLQAIEEEWSSLRRLLPATKAPALRFRKTGRHKAAGVYHPHVDNIAVDPRYPDSMLHEYVHHFDHTTDDGRNVSSSDEFRPLLRKVQAALSSSKDPIVESKRDYFKTPTEVLSRSAEWYFARKQVRTSLAPEAAKLKAQGAYQVFEAYDDEVTAFWDAQLARRGAQVPS